MLKVVDLWHINLGLSKEIMKRPTRYNNLFHRLNYSNNAKIRVIFEGSFLKQEKVIFNHKMILRLHLRLHFHFV